MGQNFYTIAFISLKIIYYIGNGNRTGTTSQSFLVDAALVATKFNRGGALILPDKIDVYATRKPVSKVRINVLPYVIYQPGAESTSSLKQGSCSLISFRMSEKSICKSGKR